MSVPKSTIQSFVSDWNGRKSWAQSQGIPINDFQEAVKYDFTRLQSTGFKMSNEEAFDSLAALKTGQNPFQTPADTSPSFIPTSPNPLTDISHAANSVRSDLQGIVTGLFHIPNILGHDVKEAATGHPGDLGQLALHLIPGETDITDLFSASGRQFLTSHPISDILDLAGASKVLDLGEAAVRSTGNEALATTIAALPHHPLTDTFKRTMTDLASRVDLIKNLQIKGSQFTRWGGVAADQQEMLRGVNSMITNQLMPRDLFGTGTEYLNPKFGGSDPTIPAGPTKGQPAPLFRNTLATMKSNLTQAEQDDVDEMMLHGQYRGQKMSIKSLKSNDAIPYKVRAAYRSLTNVSSSLETAEFLFHNNLRQVENPYTGDLAYAGNNSAWFPFEKRLLKASAKATKDKSAAGESVQTIFNHTKAIKSDDAKIPDQLKTPDDDPANPLSIPSALTRFSEYMRNNSDDLHAGSRANKGRFDRTVSNLFGPSGSLISLSHQLDSLSKLSDSASIDKAVNSIRRSFRQLALKRPNVSPLSEWLEQTLTDVKNNARIVHNAQRKVGDLTKTMESSLRHYNQLKKITEYHWNKDVLVQYSPMVDKFVESKLIESLETATENGKFLEKTHKDSITGEDVIDVTLTPDSAQEMIGDILTRNFTSDFHSVFSKSDIQSFQREAWQMVSTWKAEGVEPIFIQGVAPGAETSIEAKFRNVDVSRKAKRSTDFNRRGLLSDTQYSAWIGIPKKAMDIYDQAFISQFIDNFVKPKLMDDEDVFSLATQEYYNLPSYRTLTKPELINRYKHDFNLEQYDDTALFPNRRYSVNTMAPKYFINRYDLRLIKSSVQSYDKAVSAAWSKGMSAYRLMVLSLSPRYAAHVILGGTTMLLGRTSSPLAIPRYFREAKAMADGQLPWPTFVGKGVSEQDLKGKIVSNPFDTANAAAGSKIGQLWAESRAKQGLSKVAAGIQVYHELLQTVSNMQRAIALLDKRDHITEAELTPEVRASAARWNTTPSEWVAGMTANKVLADMQTLTPFERGLMRFAVPFYGWQRHIARYILTYPVDHPLRANFTQSLANNALGQDSSIPEYLFRLLFIGQPDPLGNQTVLDTRQWNPFRDEANMMTWGGIISSLNPVIGGALQSATGIDPGTGSLDLFPNLTFDSFYGSDTAATSTNFLQAIATQASPQVNTLLQVFNKTSSLRQAAQSNPGKFGYLLFDSLGIPWIPYKVNLKGEQIKKTVDEYGLANRAVQSALTTNSTQPLQGFSGYLPLSGYEANKPYVENLINSANAEAKSSGTTIPATDLLQLPYASPYFPEYLLANGPAK